MASPFHYIIEQHAEEAAFLWLLHSQATQSPTPNPDFLAQLEKRINTHLKGLIIAGDDGWNCCALALDTYGEAGEVFAATMLALHGSSEDRLEMVLNAVDAAPQQVRGLISALGWHSLQAAKLTAGQLVTVESQLTRGLAAYPNTEKALDFQVDMQSARS